MGFCLYSHMTPGSCGIVKSHDRLRLLYPHYHSPYANQTWQVDNLPWSASAYKFTWLFDHVVMRDQVKY